MILGIQVPHLLICIFLVIVYFRFDSWLKRLNAVLWLGLALWLLMNFFNLPTYYVTYYGYLLFIMGGFVVVELLQKIYNVLDRQLEK